MVRCLPGLLLCVAALPAVAQDLPPAVQDIVNEAAAMCESPAEVASEAVRQADLNGDGVQDWVIDTAYFICPDFASLYCGTSGCGVTTLIDGIRGDLTLHDWGTATSGGQTYLTAPNDEDKTVRFRWTGTEWAFLG